VTSQGHIYIGEEYRHSPVTVFLSMLGVTQFCTTPSSKLSLLGKRYGTGHRGPSESWVGTFDFVCVCSSTYLCLRK